MAYDEMLEACARDELRDTGADREGEVMALRDQVIGGAELPGRLASLPGWQGDTAGITRDYPIGWDAAVAMVADVGPLAVELAHRPDMDIRWTGLRVFLTTHTAGDVVTELDLVTAARLDEVASAHEGAGGPNPL